MARPLWVFLWFCSLVGSALGGFYLARRPQLAEAVTVNGESVARQDVDLNLQVYRKPALDAVILERLVAQKANTLHLSVDESKLEVPRITLPDPELERAFRLQARTQALLRQLVLLEFSPADRQQVYEDFREQLALYEFDSFALSEDWDDVRLREELKHSATFDKLAQQFGVPGSKRKLSLNRQAVRELVGSQALSGLMQLNPGRMLGPILGRGKQRLFFRFVQRKDQFSDLSPAIEEILYQSRVRLYCLDLGAESAAISKIAIPLAEGPAAILSSDSSATALPAPKSTDVQVSGLPKPRLTPAP